MKVKPVIPRELANRDVAEAIQHYLNEGAEPAALDLIEALARCYEHGGRQKARPDRRRLMGDPALRALLACAMFVKCLIYLRFHKAPAKMLVLFSLTWHMRHIGVDQWRAWGYDSPHRVSEIAVKGLARRLVFVNKVWMSSKS